MLSRSHNAQDWQEDVKIGSKKTPRQGFMFLASRSVRRQAPHTVCTMAGVQKDCNRTCRVVWSFCFVKWLPFVMNIVKGGLLTDRGRKWGEGERRGGGVDVRGRFVRAGTLWPSPVGSTTVFLDGSPTLPS
jgi:hypothetical protein